VALRFSTSPWASAPRGLVFLHVANGEVPVFWTPAPLDAPLLIGWAGGPDAARLASRPAAEVVRAAIRSAARASAARRGTSRRRSMARR
jgi:hypothetical protein